MNGKKTLLSVYNNNNNPSIPYLPKIHFNIALIAESKLKRETFRLEEWGGKERRFERRTF